MLAKLSSYQSVLSTALNRSTVTQPQPIKNPTPTIRLKLSTPQIPEFDDTDTRKRLLFWACFIHSVNERPLSTIDKFNYLLSYLGGQALSKAAEFFITPENCTMEIWRY